jgi:predicted CoA-binding protein
MRVMVIGASTDPNKYGNKAVRAYRSQGHDVLPVNPNADEVEGIPAFASVSDVPGPIDRATVYLPPDMGLSLVEGLARRGDVSELWLNPGAESPGLVSRAEQLGLNVIQGCSIVDIGVLPGAL